MDGISRSRGWDKQIPHGILPMEQLVLSEKWVRIGDHGELVFTIPSSHENYNLFFFLLAT